jgi:hypothetical protein
MKFTIKNYINRYLIAYKKRKIKRWLDRYYIHNYTINDDLTVDVDSDVYLTGEQWHNDIISVKFGVVAGNFSCDYSKLRSLKNCPRYVGGSFRCNSNQLKSLEHCPQFIGNEFDCAYNKLTSLEHCPQFIGGNFDCSYNKLTSLEHCPKYIGGNFDCGCNKLTSVRELFTINVNGFVYVGNEMLTTTEYKLFKKLRQLTDSSAFDISDLFRNCHSITSVPTSFVYSISCEALKLCK